VKFCILRLLPVRLQQHSYLLCTGVFHTQDIYNTKHIAWTVHTVHTTYAHKQGTTSTQAAKLVKTSVLTVPAEGGGQQHVQLCMLSSTAPAQKHCYSTCFSYTLHPHTQARRVKARCQDCGQDGLCAMQLLQHPVLEEHAQQCHGGSRPSIHKGKHSCRI
jgi:hypothetical protein